MSICCSRTTDVQCPGCQAAFAAEIWLIVDAGEPPDLLDRCRGGTIHAVACPACARESIVAAPCSSTGPAHSLPYFSSPPNTPPAK